jgi:hypothetical protein
MSLTNDDLKQIKTIVSDIVSGATSGLAAKSDLHRLATKEDLHRLATKADLDRMEARLTTSMGLLERDALTRLDDHETRIRRLEKKAIA